MNKAELISKILRYEQIDFDLSFTGVINRRDKLENKSIEELTLLLKTILN